LSSIVDDKVVLVTGGTGSFGQRFIQFLLRETAVKKLIVFSRDELKQFHMRHHYADEERLRCFLGDVRDKDRLMRAFDGVDIVIHAAALKQIPAAEYNPFEAVRTNVLGAQNVIDASIDRKVERVVALSTDKASSPVNLYGATKLVSDKLFVAGSAYAGAKATRFGVVRYGNVVGSRGSVIPFFRERAKTGVLPLTDPKMTRFWITLEQSIGLVMLALETMKGGEIFVPKIPSMRLSDLADAIAPDAKIEIKGLRPGEKLHEEMISETDAMRTFDRGDHYVIMPESKIEQEARAGGQRLPDGFRYRSDSNDQWLDGDGLRAMLDD